MAITALKIHPAIGIARVGNSPESFYGPERPFAPPNPRGGFKDDSCRVKRQAARFRIFAYHDDGPPSEVTARQAEITWTVHVANAKGPGIDPGPRSIGMALGASTLTGTFTYAQYPAVPVYLGELRSDRLGRLVFVGGFGKSGTSNSSESFPLGHSWYDDVCDGSVAATVSFRDGTPAPPVVGAWVVVAPPKFAPQLDSVITMYDRLYALAVARSLAVAPAATYWEHIYPILERARAVRWTTSTTAAPHAWTHPVTDLATRQQILARLRHPSNPDPRADMPRLQGGARLTEVQYAWMQQFADPGFTAFTGAPPAPGAITPEGLDRAALEACVGAALQPGIEVSDRITNTMGDPFRPGSTWRPGYLTSTLERPWQNDFYACGSGWWPVPRPTSVIPQGGTEKVSWARGVANGPDLVDKWSSLGFVLRDGDEYVEVDRCLLPQVPEITEQAIDPLALILSPSVYVRLTLPDPPPERVWKQEVGAAVSGMTARQRKATLAKVKALDQRLKVLKAELER